MELIKLVKKNPNGEKFLYKVNAAIDNNKREITLLIEKGILGQRMKKNNHLIKNSDIKLSSKKGIETLVKYAKELGNKIFLKKRKEGFEMYEEEKTDKKDNINNNSENSENKNNDLLTTGNKDDDSIEEDKSTFIDLTSMIKPYYPITPRFYYPMLPYPYEKKKKEIKFPCYVQPKLDGVRCVAVYSELFSRYGNIFPTLSHIKDELLKNTDNLLLDGELFTDDMYFEKIVGFVKKKKKTPEEEKKSLKIYFNVFDYIEPALTFEQRISNLNFFFKNNNFQYIKLVKTEKCFNENEIMEYLDKYSNQGFEGIIIRNAHGKYEPTARSINIQKLKKFIINDFDIIDFTTPGEGKENGCVTWVCLAPNGRVFYVRMAGSIEERRRYYENGAKYIGKKLEVKYQQMTHDGVPRFAVGLSIK